MEAKQIFDDSAWAYVLTLLPPDLEETAAETKALRRRRHVPNAAALMRMALAYAVSDLSLKDIAAWATSSHIAKVTAPALFYRLRKAEDWFKVVLAKLLSDETTNHLVPGYKIRAVDGTVINGPGAADIDWRVHLLCDPITGKFVSAEITDKFTAEGLARHSFNPGEIVLGDRMYATARGIHAVRANNAHVLVRLNPYTLKICSENKEIIAVLDQESQVPEIGIKEWKVLIPVPPDKNGKNQKQWPLSKAIDWMPARIFAARTKTKKVIWILTTLSDTEVSAITALKLYRLRWQIELLFKRLKSLLHFDSLPSQQGPTAKSWILARLLAAALAQKLVDPAGALSPWGYGLHEIWIKA
uniref:Transposase family protein n=1 Tax=Desulfovibrio sp. U5L TaxID=596152 RepID=I2Q3H2_9BACT